MVEGAFSVETHPGANQNLEAFQQFAHTVVTYCESPSEQEETYLLIHYFCR